MAIRPNIANASSRASWRSEWLAIFFRQIFATSNPSWAGAMRSPSPNCCAAVVRAGSPKSSAPNAEASTTLTGIAIARDHGGAFGGRPEFQPLDLGPHVLGGEGARTADRVLDDGQQLALQGAVVALGPLFEAAYDLIGRILDRQVQRHVCSKMASFWSSLDHGGGVDNRAGPNCG